jgi:hypothetical protein
LWADYKSENIEFLSSGSQRKSPEGIGAGGGERSQASPLFWIFGKNEVYQTYTKN